MSSPTLAQKKLSRADRLLKYSIIAFVIYMMTATGVLIYQGFVNQANDTARDKQAQQARDKATEDARERLNKALAENERLHLVTQQRIQCVAQVLLKPISERRDNDFAACGIPDIKGSNQSSAVPPPANSPKVSKTPSNQGVLPQQQTSPTPSQPTTSGAGDDPKQDSNQNSLGNVQACVLFGIICSNIKL